MKKIGLIILSFIALGLVVFNSDAATETIKEVFGGGVIGFETREHDFGDIKQGESKSYIFKYSNDKFEPLILTDVKTSCGCTVPIWSRAPLMQGKEDELKVVFNSTGKENGFYKEIFVTSNQGRDTIEITGNIIVSN
jgi:hypothetical protein